MKISKLVWSMVWVSSLSLAGGKYITPAPSPVEPIPTEEKFYVALGVTGVGVSRYCACVSLTRLKDVTYGEVLRVGWDINDYVGIEARATNADIEKDFSSTTSYGLFLKPQYKVMTDVNIYGLVGYAHTEVTGIAYKDELFTQNALSYGGGVEYEIAKGWGIWADVQNLLYNEGLFKTNTNLVSLGIKYDF